MKPTRAFPHNLRAAAVLALVAGPAAAQTGDALPTGTISFFNLAACPVGWSAEPLAQADGRLLLPLPPTGENGGVAGAPLTNGQDPAHTHGFSSSIDLSGVEYMGAAGCCNDSVSNDNKKSFSGTTAPSSTGLPYVQLLVCRKTAAPPTPAPAPPAGMLIYTGASACAEGWTQNLANRGRFLVGLPVNGKPGLAFGGPPLQPLEQRTHTHAFSGRVSTQPAEIELVSGCCAGGYGRNGTYSFSGTTAAASSNLPFMQLLQCQKN